MMTKGKIRLKTRTKCLVSNIFKLSRCYRRTLGIQWKFMNATDRTSIDTLSQASVGASFDAMRALRSKTLRLVSSGSYCPGGARRAIFLSLSLKLGERGTRRSRRRCQRSVDYNGALDERVRSMSERDCEFTFTTKREGRELVS